MTRPFVEPGEEFDLKLRLAGVPDHVAALTLASLWLMCAYGGVGARTRRGFGGLRIIGADGHALPEPWSTDSILSPALGHYEQQKSLWPTGAVAKSVPMLTRHLGITPIDVRQAWPTPPTFPVLSRQHTIAGTSQRTTRGWADTLVFAGQQLRFFRADNGDGRNRNTTEWGTTINPETGTVPSDRFAVGALGLPVVFTKDGPEVHATDRVGVKLRRASPLWLRPVGAEPDMRLFSFAFLGEFLPGPDAPKVHLWEQKTQGRALEITTDDVSRLAKQWVEGMAAGTSFQQLRRR